MHSCGAGEKIGGAASFVFCKLNVWFFLQFSHIQGNRILGSFCRREPGVNVNESERKGISALHQIRLCAEEGKSALNKETIYSLMNTESIRNAFLDKMHLAIIEEITLQWYMITLVHIYNRWSRSEIRCYVDGQQVSTAEMTWLVNTSDVRSSSCNLVKSRAW